MNVHELTHAIRQAINDIRDSDGEPGYLFDVSQLPEWDGEDMKFVALVVGDDHYAGGERFEITVSKRNYPYCGHAGSRCR